MTDKPFLHAGYMTKLLNNVYEGEIVGVGDELFNGAIVERVPGGFKVATGNVEVFCKEKTLIYGVIPAYRCVVIYTNGNRYFVENQADVNDSAAYDATCYRAEDGAKLRAHPLTAGEEFIVTASDDLDVGGVYGLTDGFIAPGHEE